LHILVFITGYVIDYVMYLVKCQNLQREKSCVWNKIEGLSMFSHSTGVAWMLKSNVQVIALDLNCCFNYWISTLTIFVIFLCVTKSNEELFQLVLSQVFTLYFKTAKLLWSNCILSSFTGNSLSALVATFLYSEPSKIWGLFCKCNLRPLSVDWKIDFDCDCDCRCKSANERVYVNFSQDDSRGQGVNVFTCLCILLELFEWCYFVTFYISTKT